MSPKSVHEMSPNQVTFRGQKCPRNVTKNVHEMSPKNVHEMSPKNVHEMSPKNVHEMSPFMSTKCLPPGFRVNISVSLSKRLSSEAQICGGNLKLIDLMTRMIPSKDSRQPFIVSQWGQSLLEIRLAAVLHCQEF